MIRWKGNLRVLEGSNEEQEIQQYQQEIDKLQSDEHQIDKYIIEMQ